MGGLDWELVVYPGICRAMSDLLEVLGHSVLSDSAGYDSIKALLGGERALCSFLTVARARPLRCAFTHGVILFN